MRFEQTRSQLESGIQKNQSNPIQPNTQAQNIRPQNTSNINSKPIERVVQQAPNYQPSPQPQPQQQFQQKQPVPPQQQPPQGYRLPTAGQPANFQPNPQAQPVIRPPPAHPNPNVRQPINPNQPPLIRNVQPSNQPVRPPIPVNPNPNQQPQFRPPPPQQQQQQFQRPNFQNQGPDEQQQQQQFRPQGPPVNLQRQPVPEQKIIRNPPPPQQNPNMMTEINRERTFTASHEGSVDDDDDVVIGRMVTPQIRPVITSKPIENYEQRPRENVPIPMQQPMQQQPMQQRPIPPPMMQRRESVQSIPSRPQSGLGSNHSQSPEPRMNPMSPSGMPPVILQQQQQQYRMDGNRNIPNEMSRQSPSNYDHAREPMEFNDRAERVQRPPSQMNPVPQQRQSPEEHIQRPMNPKVTQQPPQPQYRPPPPKEQIPQKEIYTRQNQEPKRSQPEQFTPKQQQPVYQEPKPNPSAMKRQDPKRDSEVSQPVHMQNRKNSVRLDLGMPENMKSPKDKSPSSKRKTFYRSLLKWLVMTACELKTFRQPAVHYESILFCNKKILKHTKIQFEKSIINKMYKKSLKSSYISNLIEPLFILSSETACK